MARQLCSRRSAINPTEGDNPCLTVSTCALESLAPSMSGAFSFALIMTHCVSFFRLRVGRHRPGAVPSMGASRTLLRWRGAIKPFRPTANAILAWRQTTFPPKIWKCGSSVHLFSGIASTNAYLRTLLHLQVPKRLGNHVARSGSKSGSFSWSAALFNRPHSRRTFQPTFTLQIDRTPGLPAFFAV